MADLTSDSFKGQMRKGKVVWTGTACPEFVARAHEDGGRQRGLVVDMLGVHILTTKKGRYRRYDCRGWGTNVFPLHSRLSAEHLQFVAFETALNSGTPPKKPFEHKNIFPVLPQRLSFGGSRPGGSTGRKTRFAAPTLDDSVGSFYWHRARHKSTVRFGVGYLWLKPQCRPRCCQKLSTTMDMSRLKLFPFL